MPYVNVSHDIEILSRFEKALKGAAASKSEGDPRELAKKLVEYFGESEHAGWDGFSGRDLYAIRKLVVDLTTYLECV